MTKHARLVLVVAGMLLVLAGVNQVSAAPAPGPALRSNLEMQQYRHELSDSIAMTYSLTNTTDNSIFVLRWQTPVDGIDANLFAVDRDGESVEYTGRLIKRAEPVAEDYIEIKAGETFSVTFDPSVAYDMSITGQYNIRYRTALKDCLMPVQNEMAALSGSREGQRKVTLAVESNSVSFFVEGRERTADEQELGFGTFAKKPPVSTPGYISCSNTQISTLTTAKSNALNLSTKAGSWLAANPSGAGLYTTWFGTYTSSRFNTVGNHFASIKDAFATKPVTINCACNQNYYAYVYPTQPYVIYVCRAFWSAPALGTDSKAGTLIHEMSHFNVTAGTDDYVYGTTGALNLAVTDPAKAINNADNHEYFAENQK